MFPRRLVSSLTATALLLIAPAVFNLKARAEVTAVVVSSSQAIGEFNHRPYVEVTATLQGTAGVGAAQHSYHVPLVLDYPISSSDSNGCALIDVLNSALFEVYPLPQYILPFARLTLGQNFIFGRGYTYASVQWNKRVTDHYVDGGISQSTDGYQILIDLANWLRRPATLPTPLSAATLVIPIGYSDSGALLRHFYLSGYNASLVFDGALMIGAGAIALRLETNLPRKYLTTNPDGSGMALPQDGKVLIINTQTEVTKFSGWLDRVDTPSSRHFEIAGVAHLPPSILDLSSFGATRQNPIDLGPVVRAHLLNLHQWIAQGIAPPSSIFLAGNSQLQFDSDGNAKGGVRLPHMANQLSDGSAGAPLGVYGGVDSSVNWPAYLGGTFQPFSATRLGQLYPTHTTYVSAVTRAADADVAARLLLAEDRDRYASDAASSQIGCQMISVNPATIPAGTLGSAYSQSFTNSGGLGNVTFSLIGNLPDGMAFSGNVLSGAPTETGSFEITIVASDADQCSGSRRYPLVVNCAPPSITTQPDNLTVCAGASARLSVAATGSNLSYQWRKGGVNLFDDDNISGATSPTLVISNSGTGDVGVYSVVIAGACGSATSNSAILTVNAYNLSAAMQSFTGNGGNGSVNVTVGGNCSWSASSSADWILVSPVSHSGNGTLSYTVLQNPNPTSRSGPITVGGQRLSVLQGATFIDVPPSHPFYALISELSARGITAGCGAGKYCPESNVTREQMAIFIERSLGVFTPPPPATQKFLDVPPERSGYVFIADFAERRITAGCRINYYCPDDWVTREQMAIFIERSLGVFTPPTPSKPSFADVAPARFSYPFIEDFARRGITSGCAVNLYCPDLPVTRAQMAVFLVRAFGL